jgi:hypothetical protein
MSQGTGFSVEPADLRAAVNQIRVAGQPLHAAATAITGPVGAAVSMNMGYETARALSQFGNAVCQAARRAQERIDDHISALRTTANNYERSDQMSEDGSARSSLGERDVVALPVARRISDAVVLADDDVEPGGHRRGR